MKSNTQLKREKYQKRLLKETSKLYEEVSKKNIPDHVDEGDELQVAQTLFNLNSVVESYEKIKKYLNNRKRSKEKIYKAYLKHYNAIKDEMELLKIKGFKSNGLERILLLDMNVSTNDIIRIQKIN